MISVIVPVYNGEHYLKEALASLASQTFEDFECICVDDGSTDASPDIVNEIARVDKRFRLVRQANQGVAAARNSGLSRAKGEFVSFLDQDDMLTPNAFEMQYKILAESGVDVVASGIQEIDGSFKASDRTVFDTNHTAVSYTPFEDFFNLHGGNCVDVDAWGKMYRRRAIEGILFPVGVFGADDYVFSYRVFSRISSYAHIDDRLYLYRMHESNVTTRMPMKFIMGTLRSREIVWDELTTDSTGARKRHLKKISRGFAYDIMSWAIKKTCRGNYQESELAELREYVKKLISNRVLQFRSVADWLKCIMFVNGNMTALRVLFPKQFKQP